MERELLIRQTKLLFPEVEDWTIEMAVDAYIKGEGELPEISEDEAMEVKNNMFQGLEYNTI